MMSQKKCLKLILAFEKLFSWSEGNDSPEGINLDNVKIIRVVIILLIDKYTSK